MINFMKNDTKVFIKEFAEQIREENHIKDYDSLVSFIYSIGGRIEKADCLWDFGAIEKNSEHNFILYKDMFDRNKKNLYKLFAECLGNLFLHLGFLYFELNLSTWKDISKGEVFCTYEWNKEQNEQAIYFAHNLLLPEYEYRKIVKENTDEKGMVNMVNVAEYFNVSTPLAINRGIRLRILKSDLDY